MSELSPLPRDLARLNTEGIAIAMTGRAFDEARKAGVIALSPLVENIYDIAIATEFIQPDENLPPTVLFVRSSSEQGKLISNWDDRWPTNSKQPQSGMYYSAASIGEELQRNGSMSDIAEYAEHIGAAAITEVSIPEWGPNKSHVVAVATGFALGQRPIRPQAPKSLWRQTVGLLPGANEDQARLKRIKQATRLPLREPFAITYSSSTPQIER